MKKMNYQINALFNESARTHNRMVIRIEDKIRPLKNAAGHLPRDKGVFFPTTEEYLLKMNAEQVKALLKFYGLKRVMNDAELGKKKLRAHLGLLDKFECNYR